MSVPRVLKLLAPLRQKRIEHKLAVIHNNATVIKIISSHSIQSTHTYTHIYIRTLYQQLFLYPLVIEGQPGQSLKVCESNGDVHFQYFISIPVNDPVFSPKSLLHQLLSKKVTQQCQTRILLSFFSPKIPDFSRINAFFSFTVKARVIKYPGCEEQVIWVDSLPVGGGAPKPFCSAVLLPALTDWDCLQLDSYGSFCVWREWRDQEEEEWKRWWGGRRRVAGVELPPYYTMTSGPNQWGHSWFQHAQICSQSHSSLSFFPLVLLSFHPSIHPLFCSSFQLFHQVPELGLEPVMLADALLKRLNLDDKHRQLSPFSLLLRSSLVLAYFSALLWVKSKLEKRGECL